MRIPKTRSEETLLAALESISTERPMPPASDIIGACGICGQPIFARFKHPHSYSVSVDHIRPLARGGSDALSNKQLAHLGCNSRKRDSLPGESPLAQALRRRRIASA